MQRLTRYEAERLMSLYTPDELAAFDQMFAPGKYRKAEDVPVTHAQMLAERAERSRRWHEEDHLERQLTEAMRTPEAVCRGNSAPHQPGDEETPPGPARTRVLPGDDLAATRAWVRYHFAPMAGFRRIEDSALLKDKHSREVWRAAAAALLTVPKERIHCPTEYLLQCVNSIAVGASKDPRRSLDFSPHASWPDSLFLFANVPAPARRRA